jgi:hypothetical protein
MEAQQRSYKLDTQQGLAFLCLLWGHQRGEHTDRLPQPQLQASRGEQTDT